MKSRLTVNDAHWSKDFVEHLRSVHFALVVTCLALLVLSTSVVKSDLETALKQIQEISEGEREIVSVDKPDSPWLDQLARKRVMEEMQGPSSIWITFMMDGHKSKGLLHRDHPFLIFASPPPPHSGAIAAWSKQRRSGLAEEQELRPAIVSRTLGEFRDFWDALNAEIEVATFTDKAVANFLSVEFFDYKDALYKTDKVPLQVENISLKMENDATDHMELHVFHPARLPDNFPLPNFFNEAHYNTHDVYLENGFHSADENRIIAVPAGMLGTTKLRGQDALKERHKDWRHGTFDVSFRELDRLTQGLQNDKLDELEAWLANKQTQETAPDFEAFGVRFPAESARRWGVLLLIAIQLYFWLHISELSPKMQGSDPGLEVPWVGIYRSVTARLMSVMSVCLLPSMTVIALVVPSSFRDTASHFNASLWRKGNALVLVGLVVIITLGMMIFRGLIMLQGRIALAEAGQGSTDPQSFPTSASTYLEQKIDGSDSL